MNLANPNFLYLLFFIPLYLAYVYFAKRKKKGISISVFYDLIKASNRNPKARPYFEYFCYFLIIIIIALWCFVLARPQGGHEKEDVSKKGIDIIIAIDVSESMLAEDLKPNRIEAAKLALEKFVDNLSDDRLGIIVFSGQAFTQSPLTFDYNILREYIKNISTDSINKNVRGLSGTAIGDAILSAVNRFKNSEDRTKVLVVITDGDANTGVDPVIAAQKAKEDGIKLYAVGVGQSGGAPLPTTDIMGRKTYAKNADGSMFMATFNEDALKHVANVADGRYFRANDNESFNEAMAEINSLEKREIKMNTTLEYTENFYPYLIALMLVLLIFLFIQAFKAEIN